MQMSIDNIKRMLSTPLCVGHRLGGFFVPSNISNQTICYESSNTSIYRRFSALSALIYWKEKKVCNMQMFFNVNGEFQWASIAAIVSLCAAVLTAFSSYRGVKQNNKTQKDIAKQNIDANIKSNARIKWIQDVRILEVEYVDDSNLFIKSANTVIDHMVRFMEFSMLRRELDAETERKLSSKYFDNMNASLTRIQRNFLLIRLYFGINQEDFLVVQAASDILESVNRVQQLINQGFNAVTRGDYKSLKGDQLTVYGVSEDYDKLIENFVVLARDYNKTEWDRAKEGK